MIGGPCRIGFHVKRTDFYILVCVGDDKINPLVTQLKKFISSTISGLIPE